jgi:hypothetical protein
VPKKWSEKALVQVKASPLFVPDQLKVTLEEDATEIGRLLNHMICNPDKYQRK